MCDVEIKKVAVLSGGWSRERDVSLVSGKAIASALKSKGYEVDVIDPDLDIASFINAVKKSNPDVIFNGLHGVGGEDGVMQSILRLLQIPFTHSGVAASAVAMDKIMTKNVARGIRIPVAESVVVERLVLRENGHPMPMPYVLKPVRDGSSMHTYIVRSDQDLENVIQCIPEYLSMMAERFIMGRELTVAVLHLDPDEPPQALGITELKTKNNFYDYEAKYQQGFTEHVVNPVLPKEVAGQLLSDAVMMHVGLGCRGVSRSDFRYNEADGVVFLEINTQPGFTELSLLPEQAQANDISFEDLVDMLVKAAVVWENKRPYHAELMKGI